jgi:hypothetical protein
MAADLALLIVVCAPVLALARLWCFLHRDVVMLRPSPFWNNAGRASCSPNGESSNAGIGNSIDGRREERQPQNCSIWRRAGKEEIPRE